jgi:hypothetical protein
VHWIELAHRFQYSKGAKKILKYEESIRKTGIVLPQRDDLYKMYCIDENAWAETSTTNDPRTKQTVGPNQIGSLVQAPPTPNVQKTAPKPLRPGESNSKQDESKVLKASTELRQKILEVGSILLAVDTYEDYLQDIINDFDHTYRSNSPAFKSVLDDPTSYSKELADHVRDVVKSVQQINKSFDSFSRGQIKFDAFKASYATISNQLTVMVAPSKPLSGSGMTKEQADVPKKNDKPVSNIDMNSMMSSEINKKIAQESPDNDDDNIYVPEHFQPEFNPAPKALTKVKAPSDDEDEEGGFMAANFDDEGGDHLGGPKTGFSTAFGAGDDDGWGRIGDRKAHPDAGPDVGGARNQAVKRVTKEINEKNIDKISPSSSLQGSVLSRTRPQPAVSIKVSAPTSPSPGNGKAEKPQRQIDESNVMDDADEQNSESPGSKLNSSRQMNPPVRMTEDDKVKLAQKNQKVLEGSGMQEAAKDFFSKPAEGTSGGVGGVLGDVFAKAKSKYQAPEQDSIKGRSISTKPSQTGPQIQTSRVISIKNQIPPQSSEENVAERRSKTVPKQPVIGNKPEGNLEEDEMTQILKNARLSKARRLAAISQEDDPHEEKSRHNDVNRKPVDHEYQDEAQETENHHKEPMDYFQRGDGGLLEDGNTDYFKPVNVEQMKKEIIKLEEERKKREASKKDTTKKGKNQLDGVYDEPTKGNVKKITQEEIKKKAEEDNFDEDFFEKAGFGAEGFSKDNGKEFYDGFFDQPPSKIASNKDFNTNQFSKEESRIEERGNMSREDAALPRDRHLKPILKESVIDSHIYLQPPASHHGNEKLRKQQNDPNNFSGSDFFGPSGHPGQKMTTAVKPGQIKVLTSQVNHQGNEINSHRGHQPRHHDDSEVFFTSNGHDHDAPVHISKSTLERLGGESGISPQRLADILSENNRLRQENSYANKSMTALEDTLTTTARQLRVDHERERSQNKTLQDKTLQLEMAYEREKKEREMFEQKYRELYLKWRQEKEVESMQASIFDPKKILELSQVNEQLKGEKRMLAVRLTEEVEKSRYVETLKEELNRTKKELLDVTKAYNSYVADMSKTNLNPEESILKDLYLPRASQVASGPYDLQQKGGQISLQGSPKVTFGQQSDLPTGQPQTSDIKKGPEDHSTPWAEHHEGPGIPTFSNNKGKKVTIAQIDIPSTERSQQGFRGHDGDSRIYTDREEDLFDRAERIEREGANSKIHNGNSGLHREANYNQISGKNDQTKFSPEFSEPISKGAVNSNGSMIYNHGIGLRSSHHSHMSHVDRLESDLLDQSDLDFLANFQRELDDTCKNIVTPKGKREQKFEFPRTSIGKDHFIHPRSSFGHSDTFQNNRSNSPQYWHSIGGNPPIINSNPFVQPQSLFNQQPTKPVATADHFPSGSLSEKFDILAPFTSSFGADLPLPRWSQPQPMRDSLYSKDSVSGATVFSTATRPTFRY